MADVDMAVSENLRQAGPACRQAEVEAAAKVGRRIPALDGLRAFAVLVVILSHIYRGTFAGGFLGVDVFFVISGYIITARLLREHERTGMLSLSHFYLKRIRRLSPALWLFAAVAVVVCLATGRAWGVPISAAAVWKDAAYALTSTMNIARASGHGGASYVGHSWSLAEEEQFYLIWPVVLLLAIRRRVNLLPVLGVMILAILAWRVYLAWHGATPLRIYMGPDTRADVLLYGCCLALLGTARLPAIVMRLWCVPAAILGILVFSADLSSLPMQVGGYTVISICSVWLVAVAVESQGIFARIMALAPIQWAGLRSYSLYLWHPLVIGLVEEAGLRKRYETAIVMVVAGIAAELSYKYVENRFARLRP